MSTTVIRFDFGGKSLSTIALSEAKAAIADQAFVWIDADVVDVNAARAALSTIGLLPPATSDRMLLDDVTANLARFEDHMHLVLTSCRISEAGLELEQIDVVMAETHLITLHRGPRSFIESIKRECPHDFKRFAQSPSFLVYEIWDHLIEHYSSTQKLLERRVETLQTDLIRAADDRVFERVGDIGTDLLRFRSVLLPARDALTELASRKTIFISEATQSYLSDLVGMLERVLQDVSVDREILAQSLNLHVSMESHRTSRTMNKLTVLSTIFLPLTFLCGVYGMNFQNLPELKWEFGYFYFWGVTGTIVTILLLVLRKNRLL